MSSSLLVWIWDVECGMRDAGWGMQDAGHGRWDVGWGWSRMMGKGSLPGQAGLKAMRECECRLLRSRAEAAASGCPLPADPRGSAWRCGGWGTTASPVSSPEYEEGS